MTTLPSRKAGLSRADLAKLFRQIGEEIQEGTEDMPRVEALIRDTYRAAFSGDAKARDMVFERGWGKVPTPVEVDVRGHIQDTIETSGVPIDVIARDPLARSLAESAGYVFTLPAPTLESTGRPEPEADGGPVQRAGSPVSGSEPVDPVDRGRAGVDTATLLDSRSEIPVEAERGSDEALPVSDSRPPRSTPTRRRGQVRV